MCKKCKGLYEIASAGAPFYKINNFPQYFQPMISSKTGSDRYFINSKKSDWRKTVNNCFNDFLVTQELK